MTLQHGPDECALNIIQTCAIRLWPKVVRYLPTFGLRVLSMLLHHFAHKFRGQRCLITFSINENDCINRMLLVQQNGQLIESSNLMLAHGN